MAWFSATPKGDSKSRLEAFTAANKEYEMPLPDLEGANYLVVLLHELGTVAQTSNGIMPISWPEMESWVRLTRRELSNWELSMLKSMSHAYACEHSRASDRTATMPYTNVIVGEIDRDAVAAKAKSVFGALIRKQRE